MKKRSNKKRARKSTKRLSGRRDASAKRRAQLRAAAKLYFQGLATKDLSRVPYDDHVVLHAPLAPGGAANPLMGKTAVVTFLNGVLPVLGKVKVLDFYINERMTRICAEAEVDVVSPPATLRVADCFTVNDAGKIVAQENHYDPRPALPPSG